MSSPPRCWWRGRRCVAAPCMILPCHARRQLSGATRPCPDARSAGAGGSRPAYGARPAPGARRAAGARRPGGAQIAPNAAQHGARRSRKSWARCRTISSGCARPAGGAGPARRRSCLHHRSRPHRRARRAAAGLRHRQGRWRPTARFRLLDPSGRRQVGVARTIDARHVKSLQAQPVMANMGRRLHVTRIGPNHLVLTEPGRAARRSTCARLPAAGWRRRGRSAVRVDAQPLRGERGDRRRQAEPQGARFRAALRPRRPFTGVVNVPLDGFEVVPHDFIAIDGGGRVRVLAPTASGVKIRRIRFLAAAGREAPAQRGRAQAHGPGGPRHRRRHQLCLFQAQARFPKPAACASRSRCRRRSISREQVVKNADAYLTVNWIMTAAELLKPGVENRCDPPRANSGAGRIASRRPTSARRSGRCLTDGAAATRRSRSRRASNGARWPATSAPAAIRRSTFA